MTNDAHQDPIKKGKLVMVIESQAKASNGVRFKNNKFEKFLLENHGETLTHKDLSKTGFNTQNFREPVRLQVGTVGLIVSVVNYIHENPLQTKENKNLFRLYYLLIDDKLVMVNSNNCKIL